MNRNLSPLPLLLALIALAPSCGVHHDATDSDSTAVRAASLPADITAEAMAWGDSATRAMSLQLRVGQLFMPAVYTLADGPNLTRISDYADRLGVGGLVLLQGTPESAVSIADSLRRLPVAGLIVAIDAETGLGMRFEGAPAFRWNSQISSAADESAIYDYGREVARECRLLGINMVLGPVMDVADSRGSRGMTRRSFGPEARRVAALGVAYGRGLEDGGVLSCAKHFPGHGAARGDSHRRLAVVEKSGEEMEASDLLPFRSYADAGLSAVMVGHIWASGLDSVRRPASYSEVIISDLLRGRLRFGGLVLTDAANMGGASGFTAVDAIRAGADMVVAPVNTEREIAGVVEAVESGRLPEAVINDRCRRILFYKYLKGIAGALTPEGRLQLSPDSLRSRLHSGAAAVRL